MVPPPSSQPLHQVGDGAQVHRFERGQVFSPPFSPANFGNNRHSLAAGVDNVESSSSSESRYVQNMQNIGPPQLRFHPDTAPPQFRSSVYDRSQDWTVVGRGPSFSRGIGQGLASAHPHKSQFSYRGASSTSSSMSNQDVWHDRGAMSNLRKRRTRGDFLEVLLICSSVVANCIPAANIKM